MPRYSFAPCVSIPLTGPLSVGTTPAADATPASPLATPAYTRSAPMSRLRIELQDLRAAAFIPLLPAGHVKRSAHARPAPTQTLRLSLTRSGAAGGRSSRTT